MGYSRQPYIIIQISGTFGLKRKITFLGDYNRKETWYQRGYLVFWRAGSYGGKRGGGGGGGWGVESSIRYGRFLERSVV